MGCDDDIATVQCDVKARAVVHVPTRDSLDDPPQLARLVVGELPGSSKELCARDWALLLILKIVEPRHEPGTQIWLSVHHSEAGTRHRDEDILVPQFDVEVLHPVERERRELTNC